MHVVVYASSVSIHPERQQATCSAGYKCIKRTPPLHILVNSLFCSCQQGQRLVASWQCVLSVSSRDFAGMLELYGGFETMPKQMHYSGCGPAETRLANRSLTDPIHCTEPLSHLLQLVLGPSLGSGSGFQSLLGWPKTSPPLRVLACITCPARHSRMAFQLSPNCAGAAAVLEQRSGAQTRTTRKLIQHRPI